MPTRKTVSPVAVSGGNRNSSNRCHCRCGRTIAVCGSRHPILSVFRDVPAPLPTIFITQTELVAEQRLERFGVAMLEIADAWRPDRSESSPNSFHIRALAPDGQ